MITKSNAAERLLDGCSLNRIEGTVISPPRVYVHYTLKACRVKRLARRPRIGKAIATAWRLERGEIMAGLLAPQAFSD